MRMTFFLLQVCNGFQKMASNIQHNSFLACKLGCCAGKQHRPKSQHEETIGDGLIYGMQEPSCVSLTYSNKWINLIRVASWLSDRTYWAIYDPLYVINKGCSTLDQSRGAVVHLSSERRKQLHVRSIYIGPRQLAFFPSHEPMTYDK